MERIISVKIPENLLEVVDRYARRRSMSRSEVIRDAILYYLAREDALVIDDEQEETR